MDNAPTSTSPNRYDSSSAPEDQFQPQTQTQNSQFNSSLPEVHNSYFSKLYELARFHFDSANYFQGLFNIDKCIEHLSTNLEDGNQSPVLQDFISKIVSDLNELALNLLKTDKPHECLRILEKCKEYTTPDKYGNFSRLRSLTYNHIGCCYRRLGNLEKALYYLQKVLILVEPADRIEILGITHINLCAVLSQMNNHKKALEQARLAVSECAYDLIHASNATGPNKQSDVKKKATMLAIAYHNLGIEESFCNDEDAALQAYFKAYKLVEEHSGVEDKLYEKFKQAHDMTLEKIMRENKTNKPKKRMPSLSKRKKGKLSPKNWYIKRAPSYSTNALAAKVYLQNGRVVVPDFKDYKTQIEENRNQSSRSRSRSNRPLSSKTQTNSSSIIKPMAPIGTKPRPKKKTRPLTAVSQGNRFSSGEPSKMSIKTSHKNLYDSGDQFIQEDDGPSGDDDSELEKFVLEDEQELQWINMKSNRLAFLSDLNQFGNSNRQSVQTTDPRVEKTFNPRSPNESIRSPPNTEGFRSHTDFRIPSDMKSQSDGFRTQSDKFYASSDVQENSPEFVTSSNPFTQPPPSKKSQSFNEKQSVPALEPSASKFSLKINDSSNKSSPFSKISERSDDWSPDSVLRKTNEKNSIHPKSTHHHHHKNHNNDLEYVEDSSLEAKESATLLQNHYKDAQKKSNRENADSERVFKVFAKTVNSAFEKRLAGKGSLPYFILMMYNWDEEYVSIQVKNLQTNKLFKSVVKYQRKSTDTSPTKEAVEEIREYCESLVERLSIIDGCIVFAEDRQVIGSYIEAKLEDRSTKESKLMASPSEERLANQPKTKPKVVIDIPESLSTPRASDNEIRPLLTGSHRVGAKSFEVRPKSTKSDAQSSREFMKGFPLHESMHYQTTPKGSSGVKPPSDRRKNVRPFSGMAKVASKDHLEHRRPKAPSDVESEGYDSIEGKKGSTPQAHKGSSFKQNPKFDSGRRKEEPNYRVVFTDDAEVQGHDLEFKISEKVNEHPEDFSTYRLACFDKDTGKNIKGLDIPRNSLKVKDLTAQDLLGFIEVDFRNGELYFKNEQSFNGNNNNKKEQTDEEEEDLAPKPLFAKKPLRIESPTDVEESIPDSKSLTASPDTNKKKANDQNAPDARRISYQSDEENTFRIKPLINRGSRYVEESPEREQLLQLDFGRGKSIDCFVSHDKKKNKVLVKYAKSDGPDGNDYEKTLSLRGETLGIPIQGFPPGSFEENMKNLLQSKLILREGDLVLGDQKGQSNISIKEREEIDEEIPTDIEKKTEDFKPLINRGGIDFSPDNKQSEDDGGSSSKEIRPMINKGYNDSARKRRYVANNPTPRSANQQQQQANRMSLGKTTLNEVELMHEAMNINEAFKDRRGTLGNLKQTQEGSNQEIDEELPDLNAEDVQAATLKIQKAYLTKKKNKEPKEVIRPLIAPPSREGSKKKIPTEPAQEEIEEELPDLKDPEVQNATLAIQKAYLRKKNKPQPPAHIVKKPVPEQPIIPQPKPEEPEEELPDLKDKDVQKATLSIQKAYKKRMEKKKEEPKPVIVVPPPKEEEPEDELPDLNAKDVQDATMKIQNAYLRKKKNQGQAPKIPHNKAPEQHKVVAPIAEVKKPIMMPIIVPPKQEEPEDEMPDLNAKDVQDATMKIQNAYLKKKQNREKAKNDPPKVDIPPQQQASHPIKVEENPVEDELPDLNAKDVQDATMKIQMAYLRKKNKKQEAPPAQQPKIVVKEETPKLPPPKQEEPEDELPDLNAKDVQDATMKIQNAYLRKKKAKAQPVRPKEEEPEFKPLIAPVKKAEPEPAVVEEEELPDIKDPEVQNATLAIQKAYLKKKNRNKPAAQEPPVKKREDDLAKDFPIQKGYLAKKDGKFVQVAGDTEKKDDDDELPDLNAKDVQDATMKIQKAYIKRKQNKKPEEKKPEPQIKAKAEEEEEMPDLDDPGVQKSTLAIQKAYMKRKARQQQKQEAVKKEEPKPQPQPPAKQEEEEEMPDLDDPGVQKSTLAIQKAYMKRKARQQQKQEPVKKEEPKPQPQPPAKEEEEEMPDLDDPGVQKSTLAIQKAYMKRKARQQQKQEQSKPEEKKPEPQPQPQPQAKAEEEEEMPDLDDPGVQKSTLAIQKAYMKRKARQQQKQEQVKKEEPKPQPQPPVKEEEEEMPDLDDPGVQKSTLAIQKAYMKKKARQQQQQQKQEQEQAKPKVEEPPVIKKQEPEPSAEEEELPDLADPGVQNATFAIQKAYKKRMEKLKKSQPPPETKVEPEKPKGQTPQEEEELPNIEDPEVQKATLAIQKAYKKRINSKLGHSPIKERASEEDRGTGESNSENEEARDQVVLDHGQQTLPESVKRSHIKPHTVPDHINDEAESPDSGSAGKKPGASHYKTSWRNHRSYTGEIPKIVIHTEEETSLNNNDLQEYIQTDPSDNPYVELISYSHPRHNGFEVTDLHRYEKDDAIEEDSDLPNLEDPDVQKAAHSIQRAYMQRAKKKAAAV